MKEQKHKVVKRDNLTNIAKKYKVKDWQDIWYYKKNDKLRLLRAKPDKIEPGDELVVPIGFDDATIKEFSKKILHAEKRSKDIESWFKTAQKDTNQTWNEIVELERLANKLSTYVKSVKKSADLWGEEVAGIYGTGGEYLRVAKEARTYLEKDKPDEAVNKKLRKEFEWVDDCYRKDMAGSKDHLPTRERQKITNLVGALSNLK